MANSSRNSAGSSAFTVIVISAVVAGLTSLALGKLAGSVHKGASGEHTIAAKTIATRSQVVSSSTVEMPATSEKSSAVESTHAGKAQSAEAEKLNSPVVTGAVTGTGGKPRYLDAVWNDFHFRPGIEKATNEQCLSCHQEIMTGKVRDVSPAGVKAVDVLAWYQTLDTYNGDQETFHARHLTTPLAKKVMKLDCNFCHLGHDPRDETANTSATDTKTQVGDAMRKMVDPSKSCLLCHGKFPAENMELEGSWAELREAFEDEETRNGCLSCHEEQFRTVRHQVNYLNAKAIEAAAKSGSSDLCYGCHGGRAWYRNSYPYPRHAWPGMDPEMPEWAKGRASESASEHRLK